MKYLLLTFFLCLTLSSTAANANGKHYGEARYKAVCAACHGQEGYSNTDRFPNLAGQKEAYLIKQLEDFKTGRRVDPVMKSFSEMLSPKEIKAISKYLSELKCK